MNRLSLRNNGLDLQTLGSEPVVMPKNIPGHCDKINVVVCVEVEPTQRAFSRTRIFKTVCEFNAHALSGKVQLT